MNLLSCGATRHFCWLDTVKSEVGLYNKTKLLSSSPAFQNILLQHVHEKGDKLKPLMAAADAKWMCVIAGIIIT